MVNLSSVKIRVIISLVLISLLSTSIIGLTYFNDSVKRENEAIKDRLRAIALTMALNVDTYQHRMILRQENPEEHFYYLKLSQEFAGLREAFDLSLLYTLIPEDEDNIIAVVANGIKEIAPGSFYSMNDDIKKAFEGKPVVSQLYQNEYGTFISAYVPVFDYRQDVVVVLGVDMEASSIAIAKKDIITKVMAIILVTIVLAVIISLFLSNKLTKPLNILVRRVEALAEQGGDLTQQVEIANVKEIAYVGEAVNKFTSELRHIVSQVGTISNDLAASSQELSSGSHENKEIFREIGMGMDQISQGMQEQAASVSQSNELVNKLASKIGSVAESTEKANQNAQDAGELSHKGQDIITEAIMTMEKLVDFNKNSSQVMASLGSKSQEIGSILVVITDISEQTNLLSLNAAIEAARAGEQGRGFAVVADEVRKLAVESSRAAISIKELVEEIQTEIKNSINIMKQNSNEVSDSRGAIENANSIFSEMNKMLTEMGLKMRAVLEMTQEMNTDKDHVVVIVEKINKIAQESAGRIQEMASGFEQQIENSERIVAMSKTLAESAENLNATVNKFKY